jgi:hypothetical protein
MTVEMTVEMTAGTTGAMDAPATGTTSRAS